MAYRLTKGKKKIPEGWQLIEDVSSPFTAETSGRTLLLSSGPIESLRLCRSYWILRIR